MVFLKQVGAQHTGLSPWLQPTYTPVKREPGPFTSGLFELGETKTSVALGLAAPIYPVAAVPDTHCYTLDLAHCPPIEVGKGNIINQPV